MDRVTSLRTEPVQTPQGRDAPATTSVSDGDVGELARLRQSEARYRRLFETALDGILVIDAASATIEDVNPFLIRLLGYDRQALIGRRMWEAPPFAELQQAGSMFITLRRRGMVRFDSVGLCTAAGEQIEVEWIGHAYDCAGQRTIQCNLRDITERRRLERVLTQMAFHDPLTHLPNRRLLLDRLEQARRTCRRELDHAGLLYIDLDDFKGLNDSRGHQAGDEMLIETARRLRTVVRDCDTVARFGGDEFVILLEHLGSAASDARAAMEAVAGKVAAALSEPYVLARRGYRGSCSLGSRLFQGDAAQAHRIIEEADAAMYVSKQARQRRSDSGQANSLRV